jgi:polyketide cyclase/dehydrase/lipid transport protein
MNQVPPIITFRVSVTTKASADAVYAVLSDLHTHLVWAGEQAPMKGFRLLDMEAPRGSAPVGAQFSSSGAASSNGKSTFHDRSTVVEAEPGARFGFDTESRLTRPRADEWRARFEHRYAIEPTADGSTITYTCDVRPQNYVPPWLKVWSRPATRVMVQMTHRKHMRNLVRMVENAVGASR